MHRKDTEAQRSRRNELGHRVIGLGIEVHRELGPSLLESAYEEALTYELTQAGLKFERRSLGLLINFNVPVLKHGIRRVVAGELFKDEKTGWTDLGQLALFLCASGPLWCKSKI